MRLHMKQTMQAGLRLAVFMCSHTAHAVSEKKPRSGGFELGMAGRSRDIGKQAVQAGLRLAVFMCSHAAHAAAEKGKGVKKWNTRYK